MTRRTRIVATLGPSTDKPGVLASLIEAGIDVARINFSHGELADHVARITQLRSLAKAAGRVVAVLADLPGPKLRVLLPEPLTLTPGQEIAISLGSSALPGQHFTVTEPEALPCVQPGQRILLADGRLQLRAVRLTKDCLLTRVETGGVLLHKKGINFPDTQLTIPALTERDHKALAVAAQTEVDWVALSFVREPAAGPTLRRIAAGLGLHAPILAKIERPEAIQHAREVLANFDGIMVARGDLGVEMPLEHVPHLQKHLIQLARAVGKPVITATDMLDSMQKNPRPTRAEASDVANAIYDGTDAVMLSGETAAGEYPLEAVQYMDKLARATEKHLQLDPYDPVRVPRAGTDDHITHATYALAEELRVDAIITPTLTGRTTRSIARHRPHMKLIAPSPSAAVIRQLAVVWGVHAVPMPSTTAGEDRIEASIRAAFAQGAVKPGDRVVVLVGHPNEGGARLPTIRVLRVTEQGGSTEP